MPALRRTTCFSALTILLLGALANAAEPASKAAAPAAPPALEGWAPAHHVGKLAQLPQPHQALVGSLAKPSAVYSTPTRRGPDNREKEPGLPAGATPFPADSRLQVLQGEVLCAFFAQPDGAELAYVVNHNAWAWQGLILRVPQPGAAPRAVSQFTRESGQWKRLGAVEEITLPLAPGDAEVLRFEKPDAKEPVVKADHAGAEAWKPASLFDAAGKLLLDQGLLAERSAKPHSVYSTETALAPGNKPKERAVPSGATPFPSDSWLQIKQGEVLCALYKMKDHTEAVCFANHNPSGWQGMLINFRQESDNRRAISELDLKTGKWTELGPWNDLNFSLAPGTNAVFSFYLAPVTEEVALPARQEGSEWSGVERIVAIGDLHGDYGQFVRSLRAAKLVDEELNWQAGKTHLVQTGDICERGNGTRKIMNLLMRLETQAAKAGGRVHPLLGNHELSILTGTFRETEPSEAAAFGGGDGYRKAISKDQKYGQWLRNHNMAIRINDVLFIHSGVSPDWLRLPVPQINEEIRKALNGEESADGHRLIAKRSLSWYRGWTDTNTAAVVSRCNEAFPKLGVRHAVVGHTVHPAITPIAGGRVIAIDTGMTGEFGGPASALIIENGTFKAVYPGQEPVLLKVDYPESQPAAPAKEAA